MEPPPAGTGRDCRADLKSSRRHSDESLGRSCVVKISAASEAARFLNRVREKGDSQGQSRHGQGEGQPHSQGERRGEGDTFEVTDDKVKAAMESFAHDEQALAAGLTVDPVGKGPGLRVVLKDGTGAIVRQFTGEEFVKLREAAANGTPHAPGKLLDRKL
jgi:hypothetical protein